MPFDLLRIDVEPAGDDQVLGAADDGNAARIIHDRHVAGDEEAVVAKLGRGLVGHAPIPPEHVRPADFEDAGFPPRNLVAVVVGDAGLDPRQRKSDGAGHALPVVGVGGDHPRFGHAVALENPVPGSLLEGAEGIGEQRRRAGDEQPHVPADFPVEARLFQKPGVERRHAHEHRRSRQPAEDGVDVELRQKQNRRAVQHRAVQRHEQAVDMIDRQGVEQHVPRHPAPIAVQSQGVGRQVGVAQHRPLRPARRPRGIENRRQIVVGAEFDGRVDGHIDAALGQRTAVVGAEGEDVRHTDLFRRSPVFFVAPGSADQQVWLGVLHEVADLGGGIGGVEGNVDGAAPEAGEIEQDRRGRLVDLNDHPVALADAQRLQQADQLSRLVVDRRVGKPATVLRFEEGGVVPGKPGAKERVEIGVFHASLLSMDPPRRCPGKIYLSPRTVSRVASTAACQVQCGLNSMGGHDASATSTSSPRRAAEATIASKTATPWTASSAVIG